MGDIGRIGLFPRGGVVGKQFHRFPTFARPMGRWFKGGSTRCSLEHSREHIRSEAESKPFRSDGVPSRRPDLSRARRIALRAYKFTSKELRRRSDDDIAEDTVLTRPLRIGGFAVWCFWGFAALLHLLADRAIHWPGPSNPGSCRLYRRHAGSVAKTIYGPRRPRWPPYPQMLHGG